MDEHILKSVDDNFKYDSNTLALPSLQPCPITSGSSDNFYKDSRMSQNLENSSNPDEANITIRSVAVVKKSQVEFPVSFRKLQSNTDLKRPPSNWFRGQFIHPNISSKHSEFTSFIMGYQFPDCIGEVDIVSDAENIKKLLKMPYNPNSHMSMMVHCVGKTLLIDEFDISQYILRQNQHQWKWLRKFFYENILESLPSKEMNVLVRPNKSRDVVQSKNLLSKFLHYSVEEIPEPDQSPEPAQSKVEQAKSPVSVGTITSPTKENDAELLLDDNMPQSSVHPFTRNIIWTFEDLRMLIGTDLPIFGGGSHPCVSLRLKDMHKPINVLTGIDYWLDNLMCNVPEVIMCYHIDGIVKKYEFVKTEDLPRMPDSQFSPELIRDIAHNILSFLKSKATKEGHTYWLFKSASKEKKDAIVKLYDLTSLCNERSFDLNEDIAAEDEEDEDSPFTVPVAMLFYCVAKNMWNSQNSTSRHPSIRSLLENVLTLLKTEEKDKYLKILCHCHYILSDIYMPQNINPDSPDIAAESEEEDDELFDEDLDCDIESSNENKKEAKKRSKKKDLEIPSIKVSSLCLPFVAKKIKQKISKPPKLPKDIATRCDYALLHTIESFNSIEPTIKDKQKTKFTENKTESDIFNEDHKFDDHEEPKMARQFEPIPMPYASLKKTEQEKNINDSSNHSNSMKQDLSATLSESLTKNLVSKLSSLPSSTNDSVSNDAKNTLTKKHNKKCDDISTILPSEIGKSIVPKVMLTDSVLNSYFKDASWFEKMKFRLLRKATLVFMTKAKLEFESKSYGNCLRHSKLAMHAWYCMASLLGQEIDFPVPTQPLLLAGDTFYYLSKNWKSAPTYIEQFNSRTKEQITLADIFDGVISAQDCNWVIKIPCDAVEALKFSLNCYEKALSATKSNPDVELKRKLGSVCNELACIYMNQGNKMCQEMGQGLDPGGNLWEESRFYLKRGLALFDEVNDKVNKALLHSNLGRLLRICAFHNANQNEGQVYTKFVKNLHDQAFKEYEISLDILKLKNIPSSPEIYETVLWEYGTALFTYGNLLLEDTYIASQDKAVVTKQIVELYDRALKYCDIKTEGKNLPLCQYRAANIHIRLAGLYHEQYRESNGEKKLRHIAELNYNKACLLFLQLENTNDALKVHLDYVVLLEDIIKKTNGCKAQWKHYLQILKLLIDCLPVINLLEEQRKAAIRSSEDKVDNKKGKKKKSKYAGSKNTEVEEKVVPKEDGEIEHILKSLLELFEKKLQNSLLMMNKLASKTGDKSLQVNEAYIKEMYVCSLNKNKVHQSAHLVKVISSIQHGYDVIK